MSKQNDIEDVIIRGGGCGSFKAQVWLSRFGVRWAGEL